MWDPGLQVERTSLAWTRTALALIGCGLLTVRVLATGTSTLAVVVAAVLLPVWAATMTAGGRRYQRARADLVRGAPLPDGLLGALVAGQAVLMGLLGTWLVTRG